MLKKISVIAIISGVNRVVLMEIIHVTALQDIIKPI